MKEDDEDEDDMDEKMRLKIADDEDPTDDASEGRST